MGRLADAAETLLIRNGILAPAAFISDQVAAVAEMGANRHSSARPRQPDICIYHGNCADGFGAAWVVWKRWRQSLQYHPGIHGESPPPVAGKHVLMVDFSYKRPMLEAMAQSAECVIILDHHKTAEADVADLHGVAFGNSGLYEEALARKAAGKLPIAATFDMQKSGAVLAWKYCFPDQPIPLLLQYVQDRDLWRFALPQSREVSAYVSSYPYDFEIWSRIALMAEDPLMLQDMVHQGSAIERSHLKDLEEILGQTTRKMVIGGIEVRVANLPSSLSSQGAEMLADGQPFAASYFDRADGQRVFSLRSCGDGLDVSEIAKKYGGGGHEHSAGFQAPNGWEGDPPLP